MDAIDNEKYIISGVYMIYSNIDKKLNYIGSSININQRIRNHYLEIINLRHNNKKMQNYFIKNGLDNFKYDILEVVDIENLIEREQYYIDKFNPYFNVLKKAYSNLGYKHTEETKLLISKINTGRKMSYDQIQRGVIARKGQKTSKGCRRTDEFKQNLSKIKKKKVIYNDNIYDSLIELSNELGIKYQTLYAMITNRNKNKLNIKYYA